MKIRKLLTANRGEIAVRIARAASELGISSVGVFSEDDATSLHTLRADYAVPLKGRGPAAYLDIDQIIRIAHAEGCDAIHPGYGFLSENAEFARRCMQEGIIFVGPDIRTLELFGNKAKARALAAELGIPLLPGTLQAASLEEVKSFFSSLGDGAEIMIKAVSGGGGRGIRCVGRLEDIGDAYARCRSEASASFGSPDVYAEKAIVRPRHVEVQIIGDSAGAVTHLWDRECSLQRRNQKLIEAAPCPGILPVLREKMLDAALLLAAEAKFRSLGTFEFLVDESAGDGGPQFAFMEVNPRLQVEHTVTEEVTGCDLVRIQLEIASGATLESLGMDSGRIPAPRGYAVQARINMESLDEAGNVHPSGGRITVFEPPSGPGIRVDTYGYAGYVPNPGFDSLLAKCVAHSHSPEYASAVRKACRVLSEFRLEGVETNIGFLRRVLMMPEVEENRIHTRFVEENLSTLAGTSDPDPRKRFFETAMKQGVAEPSVAEASSQVDGIPVPSTMVGCVVQIAAEEGDLVKEGQALVILESMKMEHPVCAAVSGIIRMIAVSPGDIVAAGQAVAYIEPADVADAAGLDQEAVDLDAIRQDLAEVIARHAATLDASRPEAVEKRRKTGQRTARENVEDLCDPGSFIEYGALALAAQRRTKPLEHLIKVSPADGLIAGIGSINGALFDEEKVRSMVLAYDYTVFAGTQGGMNHKKIDRMLHLAEQWKLPIVMFAEGGGGRPSDTDMPWVAALDTASFYSYARISGLAPLVGIVSGRCFAGNAALLGCSDVIIATEYSSIGMGGPAMIEGGGLGVFSPDEIGPIHVQSPNGVVDLRVADETAAVAAARKYLSYFQGPVSEWTCEDQRKLRTMIPENRKRSYDIRSVINTLADTGSVLELRREFGVGFITALIRIEGRPMGLIANNPRHLGGAIDSDAADKAARFMQLCDAYDLPLVSLCDTPGFMVGPEAEKSAQVRHFSRLFVTAASLSVPLFTVVLRKGYGLGAQSVAGGHFHAPFYIISWPTGEFGAMGLEGAVRLAMRKQLEAITDPGERDKYFQQMVAWMYEHGKSINMASYLEIDGVIDPTDTRRWLMRGLKSVPRPEKRSGKKRPFVDTW